MNRLIRDSIYPCRPSTGNAISHHYITQENKAPGTSSWDSQWPAQNKARKGKRNHAGISDNAAHPGFSLYFSRALNWQTAACRPNPTHNQFLYSPKAKISVCIFKVLCKKRKKKEKKTKKRIERPMWSQRLICAIWPYLKFLGSRVRLQSSACQSIG